MSANPKLSPSSIESLASLLNHPGYLLLQQTLLEQLEYDRGALERCEADKLGFYQGRVDRIRWMLDLPQALIITLKAEASDETEEDARKRLMKQYRGF